MAEQIVLTGKFDLAKTYDSAKSWQDTQVVSDIQRGMFTFEIRGLTMVSIEICGTGKVIINTDDYIDPAELIVIAELRLRAIDHDRPVKLNFDKVRLQSLTAQLIAERALWVEEWSREPNLPAPVWDVIVKWALARRRRISAQCHHRSAGEIAPGHDEYLTDLEKLGIWPGEVEHRKGLRILREIKACIDENGEWSIPEWEEEYGGCADYIDYVNSRFEQRCIFDLEIGQARARRSSGSSPRARSSLELN
jgi:hypothetical protein